MSLNIKKMLEEGVAAHNSGDLEKAEKLYRFILKESPSHADVNYNLGLIEYSRSNYKKASNFFRNALDANERIESFWLSYIKALINNNDLGDAKRAIEKVEGKGFLSNKSVPFDIHFYLATALQIEGRFAEAEVSYKRAILLNPNLDQAYNNLGITLQELGRFQEAKDSYKQAIKLKPYNYKAHSNLGIVLEELGNLEDAEACQRLTIKLKSDYFEAYNNLGIILYKLGRLKESEVSYKAAIKLHPEFAEAYCNLGAVLKELGELKEAEDSYIKALKIKSDYVEVYYNLGLMLEEQARYDEAEHRYKQAIELQPGYVKAYNNLGSALKELGRLDEAEENYRKAISLDATNSEAMHMLAALIGEKTEAAPLEYVEKLFDHYANNFESSLVKKLGYRIPSIIANRITERNNNQSLGSIVDIGCGTGLFGAEIKKYCNYLEGIDLSEKMLEIARKANNYDSLIKDDVVNFLKKGNLNFDYFVFNDVFVYIGDLSTVFKLIKARNQKAGKLAFSTEDGSGDSFLLEMTGRYSHSKKYIETLCYKYEYKLSYFETLPLRKEKSRTIPGGLYILDF